MLLLLISIFLGQPEPLCLLLGLDNLDGFADDVEPVFVFVFSFLMSFQVNQSHSASYLDLMLDNGAELYHEQYNEHGLQIERAVRD